MTKGAIVGFTLGLAVEPPVGCRGELVARCAIRRARGITMASRDVPVYVALARLVRPDEIAAAVAFLATQRYFVGVGAHLLRATI